MSAPLDPTEEQVAQLRDALDDQFRNDVSRHDVEVAVDVLWRLIAPMVLGAVVEYIKVRQQESMEFGDAHDVSLLGDIAVCLVDGSWVAERKRALKGDGG